LFFRFLAIMLAGATAVEAVQLAEHDGVIDTASTIRPSGFPAQAMDSELQIYTQFISAEEGTWLDECHVVLPLAGLQAQMTGDPDVEPTASLTTATAASSQSLSRSSTKDDALRLRQIWSASNVAGGLFLFIDKTYKMW
jgi:hypothetical protein